MRQHTHDIRNGLFSVELETAILDEFVVGNEGQTSLERVRKQINALAEQLRSLAAAFQDPDPIAAPISARELLMIWQEKHAALPYAPKVQWVDELGDERVCVDVEMMATVFQELLLNAAAFSPDDTATISARREEASVVFELVEPKKAKVDTDAWGRAFTTTRRGGYGLGLWACRRLVKANGATLTWANSPEENSLRTQIILPTA